MATEGDVCGWCGTDARKCDCAMIGEAYAHLRAAIDRFATETGHRMTVKIRPPRKSIWPSVDISVGGAS